MPVGGQVVRSVGVYWPLQAHLWLVEGARGLGWAVQLWSSTSIDQVHRHLLRCLRVYALIVTTAQDTRLHIRFKV